MSISRTFFSLLLLTVAACTTQALDGEQPSFGQRRAALTVSQEAIGTDTPVPTKYNTGDYMSVASSDTEQLVVFYDGGRIRGLRYDREGNVLDMDPWITLGRNDDVEGSQAYTDLAYGDGVYMLVYSDGSDVAPGLYVQAISTEGKVISQPALVDAQGGLAAVGFNGTDFTVASYNGDIDLIRVALDGTVIESSRVAVTTDSVTNRPQLAMADDLGLVVFEQAKDGAERKVYAARFTADGQVLDPGGVLISDKTTSSVYVSVAAGESEFMAVWGGPAGAIYGSMLDFDGNLVRSEFQISKANVSVGGGAVAFDGTHYAVVWQDQTAFPGFLYGTLLDTAGDRVDAQDVLVAAESEASQSFSLDLAWSDDRYSLVYRNQGIDGQFLGSDLGPMKEAPFGISVLPNAQQVSDVVFDGEIYIRGYTNETGEYTEDEFRTSSVDAAGQVTAEQAAIIATSGPDERVFGFGLATSGRSTLYSYRIIGDETETVLRVQPKGGTLSAAEVQPWLGGSSLWLSSNGESYLGLFEAGANANGNPTEIWAQVFDAAGSKFGEPFLLKEMERPRIGMCPAGDGYLLVYSGQEIQGAAITGSVLSLSASGEVIKDHGPVVEGIQSTSLASNGEQSLFAWVSSDSTTLFGRLLDHATGWSEPFVISDTQPGESAALAWDGEQFVAAWPQSGTALWGRNIATDGSMSSPEEFFQGDIVSPRLTAGKDGQLLLSYVRYTEWSRSRRVESRIIGDLGATNIPNDGTTSESTTGTTAEDTTSTSTGTTTGTTTSASTGMDTDTTGNSTTGDANPSQPGASSSKKSGCSVSEVGKTRSFSWLLGLMLAGALVLHRRLPQLKRIS